jgi:diguanylate cyclase (GGDEF)-like protein
VNTPVKPEANLSPRPKILVVDDTPANLLVMRKLLAKVDAELIEVSSGNGALAATLDHEFALILLDVQMPEMDGFEVAEFLSQEERTRSTPVIFVTAAYADDMNRVKGYGTGAVDYIVKPINDVILLSKVRVFLDLYRGKQELQRLLSELRIEMDERQRLEQLARHQATHDPLTGLANRILFVDRLQKSLDRAKRHGSACALFYIDIDNFKPVNDRYGHHAGDELLRQVAQRMLETMRQVDTVARLGGDEFAAVMEEPADRADAMAAAQRLMDRVSEPYRLPLQDHAEPVDVKIGASIGIALYPAHAGDMDALIRNADSLMYRAKKTGKNQCLIAE